MLTWLLKAKLYQKLDFNLIKNWLHIQAQKSERTILLNEVNINIKQIKIK
jgi:hypothetical protein